MVTTRVNHPLHWPVETEAEIRGLGRREASGCCSDRGVASNRPTAHRRSPHGRHPKASASPPSPRRHQPEAAMASPACGRADPPSIHPTSLSARASHHSPSFTREASPLSRGGVRWSSATACKAAEPVLFAVAGNRQHAVYIACLCLSRTFVSSRWWLIAAATSAVKNPKLRARRGERDPSVCVTGHEDAPEWEWTSSDPPCPRAPIPGPRETSLVTPDLLRSVLPALLLLLGACCCSSQRSDSSHASDRRGVGEQQGL